MASRRPAELNDIGENCALSIVTLPASAFRFEVEAILTSAGFDPFCPWPRQKALSKTASNLEGIFNRS